MKGTSRTQRPQPRAWSRVVRGEAAGRRARQSGSAVIEYSIITLLAIVILLSAEENVVAMVMDALREIYRAFTHALSITYPTPD